MHRNGTDAYSKVRGPKAGKNRSLYLPAAAGGLQMEVSSGPTIRNRGYGSRRPEECGVWCITVTRYERQDRRSGLATAQPSGFTVTGIAADGICHPFRVIYKGFDCFTYKVERVLRNISAKPVTVQPSGFTVTKACTQAAFPAAWRLQTSGSRCKSSVVYTPFRSALNVCHWHTAPSRDSGSLNCN